MKYLKSFFVLLLFVCITTTQVFSQQALYKNKPNIVLIVADDLGWKDVGFMGSNYYKTNNLDALAKQGMVFTNAYAAAANCAPSRACMLSGQNTPRHGVYTVGTSERGDKASRKLIPIANIDTLADSAFILSEALQSAGYFTGIIGKWHIGEDPLTQGFDVNIAGTHQGHPPSYFSPYKISTLKDGKPGEYLTDRLTTEALSFIEKQQDKPFFLYLPHYAVHTPLQAPDSLKEKYMKKTGQNGQDNSVYGAMVESLDNGVGRILKKLDELHLAENTIVIFTSDNGGIRSISHQDPLRAGKGSYYEGGIRVPLIICWPQKIKANTKSEVPVTNMDFYPTILNILSIDATKFILDGASILPLLKGNGLADRALYWHFPVYLQAYNPAMDDSRDPVFRTRPGAAIRMGDWKLHEYYEDNEIELYNLKQDIGERNNLALEQPEIVKRLHNKLMSWQRQVHAPIPKQLNPDFKPDLQFVPKNPKKR